ncbi:MAG: hypothetical protein NTY01_07355 [Verrucomicrobia bacterium]|nr:hypothetical protein [Verrucomicrobiota bacterium]
MSQDTKHQFTILVKPFPVDSPRESRKASNGISARELLGAVERVSQRIPHELRPRIEPVAPTRPNEKLGADEIDAILVILAIGSYAIRPVLNFIVAFAHERRRKIKVRRKEHTQSGIIETEATYEGSDSLRHVEAIIEGAVKQRRSLPPSVSQASTNTGVLSSDLEIEVLPKELPPSNHAE